MSAPGHGTQPSAPCPGCGKSNQWFQPECRHCGRGSLPVARNANADRLAEKFKAFAAEDEQWYAEKMAIHEDGEELR